MKKLRFYQLAILGLVLLNAVTLFVIWKGGRHHERPGRNQLVEHLGLEGQKKDEVLNLQVDHFKQKDALISKSRRLHEELFNYFDNTAKDSADISQKIAEIVENQREIEQMTFDYFRNVSELCSAEQKKELKELLHELLRRSAGPPPKKD